MTDLKHLRALCDAATDGNWYAYDKYCKTDKRRLLGVSIPNGSDIAEVHAEDAVTTRSAEECQANARFIAATDPQTVRALIDEIEALRGALEEIDHFTGSLWPQNETVTAMARIAKQALKGADNE